MQPEGLDSLAGWMAKRDLSGLAVFDVTHSPVGRVARADRNGLLIDVDPQIADMRNAPAQVDAPSEWPATVREDGIHLAAPTSEIFGRRR